MARLLERAEVTVVPAGQRLWLAGDRPARVGLVLSGQVKRLRRSGRREVIVDVGLPGDVFGDLAFALGEPLQASIVGLQRARVLLLPEAALLEAFQAEPCALASALRAMARRVERLERQVERLSNGSVTQRLAATLAGLADRAGAPFPGGVLVPVRLRRADLAAMTATTPESVSRQMGAWRRGRLVLAQPVGFLVRDVEALRRIARDAGAHASARSAGAQDVGLGSGQG